MKIFLGGTKLKSDWRKIIIADLTAESIDYYDPDVDIVTPETENNEILERAICDYVVHFITKKTENWIDISILVEDVCKKSTKTAVCFSEFNGFFKSSQTAQVDRLKAMVIANGATLCGSYTELINWIKSKKV